MNRSTVGSAVVALSVAGTMFLSSAFAQDQNRDYNQPRDTRQQQTRPGAASQEITNLQSLEGQWKVTLELQGTEPGTINNWEGMATRRWLLDGSVLQEEFRITSGASDASPAGFREGQTPQAEPASGEQHDLSNFQGLGLFTFDQSTGEYNHVWVDNMKGCVTHSTGDYNASTKTYTFEAHQPSDSGSQYRSISGEEPGREESAGESYMEKFTLRVVDQNRHELEISSVENGEPKVCKVTYTRAGTTTTPRDPGNINQPDRDSDTPDRPGTETPDQYAGKQTQLEILIGRTLMDASLPSDTVTKHSSELAEDIVEDYREGDTANLEAKIRDALEDAGIETGRAASEATKLTTSIRALMGS